MTSQNEWCVYGDVVKTDIRKRSVIVTVKGKIFRPKVFGVNGIIECIMTKELYEAMHTREDIEFTGHMILGKKSRLIVEKIKTKKGVVLEVIETYKGVINV